MASNSEKQKKWVAEMKDLVFSRQYLFDGSPEFIQAGDYLAHFDRHRDSKLKYFPCPANYELKILDKYKENVVCASFIRAEGTKFLACIIQLNEDAHLLVTLPFINDGFRVNMDIYARKFEFYRDFLAENEGFEYEDDESNKRMGFNLF